jgi:drug/metabolite transporter (DMT)-like permease
MYRFAPLFVIIAALLWGIDGIVLRPALYSLPVPIVVLVESSLVAVLLSPFFFRKLHLIKLLNKKDWLAFLAVALFGGAIGTMAITKALFYVDYVNLTIVILIQKLQPLFALFLAAIILKEKLPKIFFLWAGIAIIGTYIMTFGFSIPIVNAGDKTPLAALFALIAAISFAASTIFSKRALRNVGFEVGTYLRFLVSSLIMLVIVLSVSQIGEIKSITLDQFIIFIIIAFTTGGLAIFLYYYGLKNTTASVATICELAFPLTAIVLEFILRDNLLSIVQWAGVLVLVFGIYKVTSLNKFEEINKASYKD